MYDVIKSIQLSSSHGSYLSSLISQKERKKGNPRRKFVGLKSHDYHLLIQQILPVCLVGKMAKGPRLTIMRLSLLLRKICAKVYNPDTCEALKEEAAFVLCCLEMHFPPSFFDVMTHLLIHLVEELDLGGLWQIVGCTQ